MIESFKKMSWVLISNLPFWEETKAHTRITQIKEKGIVQKRKGKMISIRLTFWLELYTGHYIV